jgi:hypothetical protein
VMGIAALHPSYELVAIVRDVWGGSWFLATVFRRERASFGRRSTPRGSQRRVRGLHPTKGLMRSKDEEYRQRNHRPSY